MSRDTFRVIATGLVTCAGEILLGKKPDGIDHPISGEWHFPGGHMDEGENPREAVRREIKEETGLEVEIHQLIDIGMTKSGVMRVFFHCESDSMDAGPEDDLVDVKWVSPENLEDELEGQNELEVIDDSSSLTNFVEKLKKMPSRGSL